MTIPTNRTLATSKEDHVSDHNGIAELVNNAVPAATPFTTTTMPNTYSGLGNIVVLVLPVNDVALAITTLGETFPKVVHTDRYISFGDGTVDPISGNAYIVRDAHQAGMPSGDCLSTGNLLMNAVLQSPADSSFTDHGIQLISPNGTRYFLSVDNAGALSTVVVP